MGKIKKAILATIVATCILGSTGCKNTDPSDSSSTSNPSSSATVTGVTYYVSNNGTGDGKSITAPTTVYKAVANAQPGDVIYLLEGTYKLDQKVTISDYNSGKPGKMILMQPYSGHVAFDFSSMTEESTNRGIQLDASYWHMKNIEVYGAGDNGVYIGGNYNIIEGFDIHDNRDTGLQLGRSFSSNATIDTWPHDNLILNCSSYNNCDITGENADGFACKLTTGHNNVFDGCMAYNNSDDGWDLYTKGDTGKIGSVTIRNSLAFYNGLLTDMKTVKPGSDGNGFKLGGTSIAVNHYVENCIAFNNLTTGFTDNSNPGIITMKNCTAYNNGEMSKYLEVNEEEASPNFAMARTADCQGAYDGLLSIATNNLAGNDTFKGDTKNSIFHTNNGTYKIDKPIVANSRDQSKIGLPYLGSLDVFLADAISTKQADLENLHQTLRDEKGYLKLGDLFKTNDTVKNLGADFSNLGTADTSFTQIGMGESGDQLAVSQALNEVLIPGLNDTVMSNLNLPTSTANGCSITWKSSNENVLSSAGVVGKPNSTTEVIMTATVSYGSYKTEKEFRLSVYVESGVAKVEHFKETFHYGNNAFLGSSEYWDYSGSVTNANILDHIKEQSIPENYGVLELKGNSKVSFTTQAITFSTTNKTVMEFAFLQYGATDGLTLSLVSGANNVLEIKVDDHALLSKKGLLDGVWYTARVVVDPTTKEAKVYLYNLETGKAELVETVQTGDFTSDMTLSITNNVNATKSGLTYFTGLEVGSEDVVKEENYQNFNISKAISKVEGIESQKIINVNENFTSDEANIKVYSRFNPEELLVKDQDYKVEILDIPANDKVGKFTVTYRITLTSEDGYSYDVKQNIFYVEEGATVIESLKSTTISNGSITLNIKTNRPDGHYYYALVKAGSTKPTASDLKAQTVTGSLVSGVVEVNDFEMSFKINAASLDLSEEYDVYVVADNTSTTELSDVAECLGISTALKLSTFEDLEALVDSANESEFKSATIRLVNDIDCENKVLNIVDNYIFSGLLDGNGYKISNLVMNGTCDNVGLFEKIREGKVQDLTFENVTVTNTNKYTAILAGKSDVGVTVSNVKFINCNVDTQTQYSGLLFSRLDATKDVLLENISAEDCTVSGDQYVGMLFGGDQAKDIIMNNISVSGKVNSRGKNVGGIVGRNTTGIMKITNLYLDVIVRSETQNIAELGAIIGNKTGTQSTFVTNAVLRGSFIRQALDTGAKDDLGNPIYSYTAIAGRTVAVSDTNKETNFVKTTNVYLADMSEATYMEGVEGVSRFDINQTWLEQTLYFDFTENGAWKVSGYGFSLKDPKELMK